MKTEQKNQLIAEGINNNLFIANVCYEGQTPIKDPTLIEKFLNLKQLDIQKIIKDNIKVVLW